MRKTINTDRGPSEIGTYSMGIIADNKVYTSGQIAINPQTKQLMTDDFRTEVEQVLSNVKNILEAGGSSLDQVIKFTVYLTDLGNFTILNDVFLDYFTKDPPARSTVEVSALPMGVNVEIDAIGQIQ